MRLTKATLDDRWYGKLGAQVVTLGVMVVRHSSRRVLQGLIICRTQYLLHDPTTNDIQNKQSIASMVGHEVAHMWFV